MDDINLVVLNGRVAAKPELREFESGSRLLRILVTTRTEEPRRRVDVLPVTLWEDDENKPMFEHVSKATVGSRIYVVGAVQRRFWTASDTRKSRIEVIARFVQVKETE